MKIPDALEIIKDCIDREVSEQKHTGGTIEIEINYNSGAIRDVQVMPKRKYVKSKNEE
jgi:hypothetical protein